MQIGAASLLRYIMATGGLGGKQRFLVLSSSLSSTRQATAAPTHVWNAFVQRLFSVLDLLLICCCDSKPAKLNAFLEKDPPTAARADGIASLRRPFWTKYRNASMLPCCGRRFVTQAAMRSRTKQGARFDPQVYARQVYLFAIRDLLRLLVFVHFE